MPPRKGESSTSTVRSPARAAVLAAAVPAEPLLALLAQAGADHLVPELREGVGRRHLAPEAAAQQMEPLGEGGRRVEAAARGEGVQARQPLAQPLDAVVRGERAHRLRELCRGQERHWTRLSWPVAPRLSTPDAPC